MKKFLNFYKIFFVIVFIFLGAEARSYAELPDVKILGGSYEEIIRQDYDHERFHAHHLISKKAWRQLGAAIVDTHGVTFYNRFITDDYYQEWAPAILMEKEDHEQTRSYKNNNRVNYETKQLLTRGAVMQLLNGECRDIRAKFGDKYDKAVAQMFASIRGQFRHQGDVLLIRNVDKGYYARYEFGDISDRAECCDILSCLSFLKRLFFSCWE